jgi:hypothetical protein
MWRRLFMLALCVMPALWADVCDGLPVGPPKGSELFGSNEPLSFKLTVKSGGAAFRITVRPIWQIKADDGIGESAAQRSGFAPKGGIVDDTHAGDIEVARCQDGKRLQALPIMADQPLSFGSTFHAEDINFDGFLDFSIVTEFSGANGDIRSYWVYDPGTGIFIQNEFTHELRCGSVAVTSKNGGFLDRASDFDNGACQGAAFIDFDPEKREIGRRYFDGAMGGCPNTGEGKSERYRVVNQRMILIHKQEFEQMYQGGVFQFCAVTEWDLIGGTMRVTKVRRFDMNGKPLK